MTQGHKLYQAAWSPDGEQILLGTADGILYLLTPGSGDLAQINPQNPGTVAAWSLDGSQIDFYGEGEHISVVNPDGTNLRQLAEGSSPTWSPDGSQVPFVKRSEQRENQTTSEIRTIQADGSGLRTLFTFSGEAYRMAWLPSGEQILFVEFIPREEGDLSIRGTKLYLVDADGNNLYLLDVPYQYPEIPPLVWEWAHPTWSPNGQEILYLDNSGRVFRYLLETGEFLRVAVGDSPIWDSTGDRIAFMKFFGEQPLCVVPRDIFSRTDFWKYDIPCTASGFSGTGDQAGWRP